MPKGRPWPDESKGRIRADYEAGSTRRELHARYGVALATLSVWINKEGWLRPPERRPEPNAPLEDLLGQALDRELRAAGTGLTGAEANAAMLRAQRLNFLSLAVGRWRAMSAVRDGLYDPRSDEELRIELAQRLERVSLAFRNRRLSGRDEPAGEIDHAGRARRGSVSASKAAQEG